MSLYYPSGTRKADAMFPIPFLKQVLPGNKWKQQNSIIF